MDLIKACDAEQLKSNIENFNIGDTVKIHYKIIEGKTERVQVFEGIVITMKNSGIRKTFTVRKISYGVGVERTFPLHSPKIVNIEKVREGRVRRAKLYYIRERVGKAAKVKENIQKKSMGEANKETGLDNSLTEMVNEKAKKVSMKETSPKAKETTKKSPSKKEKNA
jgi:large subunit ribosomal protein L19